LREEAGASQREEAGALHAEAGASPRKEIILPQRGGISMGSHIVDGQFQSAKYPSCPPGKVPLSVNDKTAQDLLWEYAQRRRAVDSAFSSDLEAVLRTAGYDPVISGPPTGLDPREALRAMVVELLTSAVPHPTEHPTMHAAWTRARKLLDQYDAEGPHA
jgi:hypothetical protein